MGIKTKLKATMKQARFSMRDATINARYRKGIGDKPLAILSSDCTGGMLLHDLGKRFNSPTVNLYMDSKDFIKFCNDYRAYLSKSVQHIGFDEIDHYPIGDLDGLKIRFVHYKSFEEAKQKWEKRARRLLEWDNEVYIIMNDRNGCTLEDILHFDALPFKHKVIFVHSDDQLVAPSAFKIPGFENSDHLGVMTSYCGIVERRYDAFNWVNFFK